MITVRFSFEQLDAPKKRTHADEMLADTKYDNFADPGVQLHRSHSAEIRRMKASRLAETSTSESPSVSSGSSGWACLGCGQQDHVNGLVELADRSGVACKSCGAVCAQSIRETAYDASRRGETGGSSVVSAMANLESDQLEKSSGRQRGREKALQSGAVPKSLQMTTDRINRKAVADRLELEASMDGKHRRRSDDALRFVHGAFAKAGLDPDSNELAKRTSMRVLKVYELACVHGAICRTEGRACVASLVLRGDAKLVARVAIKTAIDEAEAAAGRGEAIGGIGPFELRRATKALRTEIVDFLVSKMTDAEAAFSKLLATSATELSRVCEVCTETTETATTTTESECDLEVDEGWLATLRMAIRATVELQIVKPAVADVAVAHVGAVVSHSWLKHKRVGDWDVSLVAAIVAMRCAPRCTARSRSLLKKIAGAARASMEAVDREFELLPLP